MIVKRILLLLPLVCLALSGCPQKRKIREKSTSAPSPGPVGSTGAAPKSGNRKAGASSASARKKPSSPPRSPKAAASSSKYQCTVAGNCILESGTCCPACLDARASSMQAMNKVQWKKFQQECKAKKETCKKCKNPGFNTNFVVLCENNKCVVRDFRATAHSRCGSDADCVLRAAPCCDCMGPPVALSKAGVATYQAERCGARKCKACAAAEFSGVSSVCVKGSCEMKGQWKKKKIVSAPKKASK